MEASWNIAITEPSQVGEARRNATALASSLLFNETETGKVALVVTEIGNNILRHAESGELLIRSVHDANGTGVEILGVDHGAGMSNINRCMEDGYSTTGTAGIGLGGIRRLSGTFSVDSTPGKGTVVLSRIYRTHPKHPSLRTASFDWGVVMVPHPHERVSGDGYFVLEAPGVCTAMIVDGLGHGLPAAEAAQKACHMMQEFGHQPLDDLLQNIHLGLRGGPGAAIGIARILVDQQQLRFIGIGNIAGCLVHRDGTSKSVMSYPGIIGHEIRKPKEMTYSWTENTTLVMHSDGLQSQWNAHAYLQAMASESSLLAATLYRDFNRGRDDVTVLTIKWRPMRSFAT
ncbi:MAG TPA: ATP-binding SpoIIE family protein phosphatase [Oligoflexus sp.]|uniref:ATP-binding SpoIIE family protein phosphatase n=1 Tax=Oligoflexus sp. TaxID=1971216 RepID=UPI002D36CBA7|nr:ATP-binding SpoIIE family protein phosphatase [Oligoflexus sp.]HYX33319.1 ATP-binding SpoIIE family protein phosphatase [Oligoflexus sp.]